LSAAIRNAPAFGGGLGLGQRGLQGLDVRGQKPCAFQMRCTGDTLMPTRLGHIRTGHRPTDRPGSRPSPPPPMRLAQVARWALLLRRSRRAPRPWPMDRPAAMRG
jgi:hypothetical protein